MSQSIFFFVAVVLGICTTHIVRWYSYRHNIVDDPSSAPERKMHSRPIALLGGIAVYGTFALAIAGILLFDRHALLGGYLHPKHLVGILVAGAVLMVYGVVDARRAMAPSAQLAWTAVAAIIVIASGIGIQYIANPLGGTLRFDQWSLTVFSLRGMPYRILLPADLLAFLWLMGSMYTTKLLDGLDGLVSGVTVIGMIILAALSMSEKVGQPETALLAIIAAGAFAGFLVYNFAPATIFLGEGGATFAGLLLGTLAIISGGKIATALLILGLPILDVIWVIARRLFHDRTSVGEGDRKHLHFRLVDMGLSTRQAVLLFYLLIAVFGATTLFFNGRAKLLVLLVLVVAMVALSAATVIVTGKKQHRSAGINPISDE